MSRKTIWIALVVVLALNVVMALTRARNSPSLTALWEDERARETQVLSHGYRTAPLYLSKEPFGFIGSLATSSFWTKEFSLSKEQSEAILKLDNLVWSARIHSMLTDADYMDGNPADYREYAARNNERRTDLIRHAQRMVRLGLLTEPQAAFVTHRFLSVYPQTITLGDYNVQELLGMTKAQKAKLAEVWEAQNSRQARLNLWSVDPQEQKEIRSEMDANNAAANAAALKVLTPSQRETWSQLVVKPTLPAEPPDVPTVSDAEAAQFKIEDLSPTFRALAEESDVLNLSHEQMKHLKELKEVIHQGLIWISFRNREQPLPPDIAGEEQAGRVAQTRAEFVKQAEQVALLGILTERQADRIQAAIKKS